MQITKVQITPVELPLRFPYRTIYHDASEVNHIEAVFVRIETRSGEVAWGCAAFDSALTGETLESVIRACQACADRARDLNPLNTAYALSELEALTKNVPAAQCAFDIAFYDLLGLAAHMPLYRLLGGYRDRIQTSITINLGSVRETVKMAQDRAQQGFRILKIKGGFDPEEDVRRVQAVHQALPNLTLRLDAEQAYTVSQALDVARILEGKLEMLEQPTPKHALEDLRHVTENSPTPILADESITGPASALEIATQRAAHGLSVKLATCGGLRCARQIDDIARAAHLVTMVGCVNEPALLIAAGLSFALSSPSVHYCDLDGHFDLVQDPTAPGFVCEKGWLIARDIPGLGCTVAL